MKKTNRIFRILAGCGLMISALLIPVRGSACSRVVFLGDSVGGSVGLVLVGRTLDWKTPIPTNLYVYPPGLARQSMPEGPMLKWTSKYASVMAVGYDGGVTEGMNEAGLVMNSLFCKVAEYTPQRATGSKLPVVSMAVFVSYFLDNFSTVDEVARWLSKDRFVINAQPFDGGTVTLLHFALTDRTGNTLIMEYQGGRLNLYQGRDNQVLTNDPFYPSMLAINRYWEGTGGQNFLPGGVKSPDRFVRASYFIHHVPTDTDSDTSFAALASIMGTVTVPYGYEVVSEPNISSTQWRSISDATNGRYHFKLATSPDFYIDLGRLQLAPGAPCLKLDTSDAYAYSGCVNSRLKKTEPFRPMW